MKTILFCLLTFFATNVVFSQDIIQQKNGEKIQVKITELADNYVKFYYFDDPNRVEVKMNRSLIRNIDLEYGRKETVQDPSLNENYFIDDHTNNVKLNFSSIGSGSTMFSYEKAINPFSSWEASVKIHGLGIMQDGVEKSGFGLEGGYKLKFGKLFGKNDFRPKHLLAGTYLKPGIGFSTIKRTKEKYYYSINDYKGTTATYNYFHGGLDFGKQFVINNRFSVEPYLGFHYFGGDFKVDKNENCEYCDEEEFIFADGNMIGAYNRALRYGINVGYTF